MRPAVRLAGRNHGDCLALFGTVVIAERVVIIKQVAVNGFQKIGLTTPETLPGYINFAIQC